MLRRRTATLLLTALFAILVAVRFVVPAGEGLRGQYFRDGDLSGAPAAVVVDRELSVATMYERWQARPPAVFSVQWSGYVHVERAGRYTFWLTSDDGSRLYVDGKLIVQNDGMHAAATESGAIALDEGSHDVLLQYRQQGGAWALEWSWAREGQARKPVPSRVLATRPQHSTVVWMGRLESVLWVLAGLLAVTCLVELWRRRPQWTPQRWLRFAAPAAVLAALSVFYLTAAQEHARVVNLSKARGDQSGFLADAEQVYANWNGLTPPGLIGQRNRMALYAAYLALFYDPQMSDDEYFIVARTWNIRLSLVLLAFVGCVFAWHLPPLPALNLTLITAFSVFVFKAGYSQPELLYYTLVFATFVVFMHLLEAAPGRRRLVLGMVGGVVAALAYLTKAAVMPLVAIFVAVCAGQALLMHFLARRTHGASLSSLASRLAAPVLVVATGLIILSPYLINNKKTFGRYFYNVNTTFYVWYDSWPEASVGTILHGDAVGWPKMPEADLPSMGKYWRTHSFASMGARIAGGLKDMVVRSFNTNWYFKYVALYAAIVIAAILVNGHAALGVIRSRPATTVFFLTYSGIYLLAIAFYEPISGTGTGRFLLASVTPLLFVASCFLAEPAMSSTRWRVGGLTISMPHVHLFIALTIALDIIFVVWPRLMTTYGGF